MIEVDGSIHDYQKYYDEQRDLILNKKNLNVLRFKNEELNDIRKVKNKILEHLI